MPTALLRDTAEISLRDGSGAYGPVMGDPLEVPCRLTPASGTVRSDDGQSIEAVASADVRADVTVTPDSTLACNGETYRVLRVSSRPGLTGPVYQTLTLGRSEAVDPLPD